MALALMSLKVRINIKIETRVRMAVKVGGLFEEVQGIGATCSGLLFVISS